MNNPARAAVQRRVEATRLLRLGGRMSGGRALEIGCGRGVGIELILDRFGAGEADAFDLDHRMVRLARRRVATTGRRVRLWIGDAVAIPVPDASYDAVFDFGIIHHVPNWRRAIAEMHRVLKPGARLYAEEVLRPLIVHPVIRRLLAHPQHDRFDAVEFASQLQTTGFDVRAVEQLWGGFAWFCAVKPA
ncbi:MAG: class I SAM-dependent methyltransferase [Acidobacteriota bacterium]